MYLHCVFIVNKILGMNKMIVVVVAFVVSTGVNTAVAPVYLSEIAPIRLRGALGVLNQLGIVTGILVGLIFGLKQVYVGSVTLHS